MTAVRQMASISTALRDWLWRRSFRQDGWQCGRCRFAFACGWHLRLPCCLEKALLWAGWPAMLAALSSGDQHAPLQAPHVPATHSTPTMRRLIGMSAVQQSRLSIHIRTGPIPQQGRRAYCQILRHCLSAASAGAQALCLRLGGCTLPCDLLEWDGFQEFAPTSLPGRTSSGGKRSCLTARCACAACSGAKLNVKVGSRAGPSLSLPPGALLACCPCSGGCRAEGACWCAVSPSAKILSAAAPAAASAATAQKTLFSTHCTSTHTMEALQGCSWTV